MRVLINCDKYGDDNLLTGDLKPDELLFLFKILEGVRRCKKEGYGKDGKIVLKGDYGELDIQVIQTCSKMLPEETLKDEVAEVLIEEAHQGREDEPL